MLNRRANTQFLFATQCAGDGNRMELQIQRHANKLNSTEWKNVNRMTDLILAHWHPTRALT